MTTAHQAEVGKLAAELTASDADYEAMHKDPGVWNANYRLTQARNALNLDRHNQARQQSVAEAEREYNVACNDYWRNLRLAKLAADKAAKAAIIEQEQAKRASEIEAEAKAQMLDSWLRAGGTVEKFNLEWDRPGGLWAQELQRRALAADAALHRSVQFRTEATAHANAPLPVPAVPAVEMVMVEAPAPAPDVLKSGKQRHAVKNSDF